MPSRPTMLTKAVATAAGGLLVLAGAGPAGAAEVSRSYLVVSTGAGVQDAADLSSAVRAAGGARVVTYSALGAAVAQLTPAQAKRLAADPSLVVSPDGPIHATAEGEAGDGAADVSTAVGATSWGLDRIDQRTKVLNGQFHTAPRVDGRGVHVYLLDSGLPAAHPEFAGRVGAGYTTVADGNGWVDCYGHGTHVGGTIGSSVYGVAPKVILHPVRVLDCTGWGTWGGLFQALNWVARTAPAAAVANASLSGDYNPAANAAVAKFVQTAKMPLVVAAGNEGRNAALASPASAAPAITVGALNRNDARASYSNWGPALDIFAPGTDIRSTDLWQPGTAAVMSGTSMAAPHVAGYLALFFSMRPGAPNATATNALLSHATRTPIVNARAKSPNRVVFTSALRYRRPSAPRALRLSANIRNLAVHWAAPASNGGAPITGYLLTRTGGGLGTQTVRVPAGARSHLFTGLTPKSGYRVTVRAVNWVGAAPLVAGSVATKPLPPG